MAVTAKVTSKGQITIPKEVRDSLRLTEGCVVVFESRDGEAVIRRVKTLQDFRGSLRAKGGKFDFNEARRAARTHVARKVTGRG
jgi:AbrB family looped-hinge helix DNA binding protein